MVVFRSLFGLVLLSYLTTTTIQHVHQLLLIFSPDEWMNVPGIVTNPSVVPEFHSAAAPMTVESIAAVSWRMLSNTDSVWAKIGGVVVAISILWGAFQMIQVIWCVIAFSYRALSAITRGVKKVHGLVYSICRRRNIPEGVKSSHVLSVGIPAYTSKSDFRQWRGAFEVAIPKNQDRRASLIALLDADSRTAIERHLGKSFKSLSVS